MRLGSLALVAVLALAGAPCIAQTPAKVPPKAQTPNKLDVKKLVRDKIDSIFAAANDSLPLGAAASEAQHLFDQVMAYAPEYPGALAEAAFAQRFTLQLSKLPEESRKPLMAYLTKHQELAKDLVFIAGPKDTPKAYYGVLERLIAAFGDQPGELASLTAAICVVHDRPIIAEARSSAQEKPATIDPVEVFRFFSSHEKQMVYGLRKLPPELLVYIVDGTAKIDEMEWALARHGGDRNIGKQYDTIVYDTAHLKYNKPKKIDAYPYTLENIRKVGGVCAEQAYYVANAGKAVGVPAVSITGRSPTMAHAWAGVLHMRGSNAYSWSLEEGCFGEYRKLRGNLIDPQSRERISSAELHLLAELMSQPERDRHTAIAYADAAHRFVLLEKRGTAWPPEPLPGLEAVKPHPGGIPGAMAFLERAVKVAPTSVPVWTGLAPMAQHMTPEQRTRWSEALLKSCEASPDFSYRIMGVMIDTLDDAASQAQIWAWVANRWNRRPDLKANALMAQGAALEKADDKAGAFACYESVWQQLLNEAPEAVDAILRAEKLLKASGRKGSVVDIYADAFRRISKPDASSAFAFTQSSYYRIGDRYAKLLDDAGRAGDARTVRTQLSAATPKQ